MRKIKFRAWHPDTKEILPVEDIDWDETGYLTEVTAGYTWGEKFHAGKFQQLVLMQYTGLKDVNGKEIYEGDIVKRLCLDKNCEMEHTGEVVYQEMWGMYGIKDGQYRGNMKYLPPLAFGNPGENVVLACEVVGNIYENR